VNVTVVPSGKVWIPDGGALVENFFHSLCLLVSKFLAFCARGMPRGAYFKIY
jgi:hypothetical protein